ncbi:MAG: prolipoprotein diacylglyceryl transferase [Thermoguttaceae bacterium]|nr:prolipoprotein diacylglyceryl transferase [Thermoguttaceae bacterium]
MQQTLFFIPERIGGVPVFGFGVLLAVWAAASLAWMLYALVRYGWRNAETWNHALLLAVLGVVIWQVMPRIAVPGQGLPVRGYGVLLLLGILAGTGLTVWRGRRVGLDGEKVATLCFWGVVCGIIGSRAFYVIQYWPDFQRPTLGQTLGAIVNITQGGIVVYGALIGGLVGFAVYGIKEKMPLLASLDLLAPGMLLGLAIGRVGCFLNGCCFGGACDLPWAVRFPAGSPPYLHQAEHGDLFLQGLRIAGSPEAPPIIAEVEPGSAAAEQGLAPGQRVTSINGLAVETVQAANDALLKTALQVQPVTLSVAGRETPARWSPAPLPGRSLPIHPTQLYSAIDALVLCLFLLAYDPFRRRDGELLAMFLTLYPVTRFLMEQIRTDEAKVWITHLTIGQVFSVGILAMAIALWGFLLTRAPAKAFCPEPVTARQPTPRP